MEKDPIISAMATAFNRREARIVRFDGSGKFPGMEEIHRLRVAVKKNRALLEFLEGFAGKKIHAARYRKLCDRLFRSAGALRETQQVRINLDRFILSRPLRSELIAALEEMEAEQKKKFRKQAEKLDRKKLAAFSKIFSGPMKKFKEKPLIRELQDFTNDKLKRVKALYEGKCGKTEIHSIRKELKTVLAVHSFLPGVVPGISANKEVNRITQVIGDLHDDEMMRKVIGKLMKKMKGKRPARKTELRPKKRIRFDRGKVLRMVKNVVSTSI